MRRSSHSAQVIMTLVVAVTVVALAIGSVHAGGLFGWGKERIKGSGKLITQSRDLPEFTRIRHSGSADLNITIGEPQVVTVTFDDNLVEVIETEVEGSTLYIGSSRNVSYSSSRGCRIDITVAGLNEVELKGSGDVLIDGLDSDLFAYTVAGSGDLVVRGSAREIEIAVKGSGDINARDLIARDAYVRIMGSGDVQVHATESFDGSVYGSGDIRYYGNPAHISTRVAGSGEISKR
jgi:hypothetical protein